MVAYADFVRRCYRKANAASVDDSGHSPSARVLRGEWPGRFQLPSGTRRCSASATSTGIPGFYKLLTPPAHPPCRSPRQMVMTTRNPAPLSRHFAGLILVASVALALTTATHSSRSEAFVEKSLLARSNVPEPVRAILQRACQDCHSENTIWPWYAHIPPISRQIHSDVQKGRAFMDLSKWNEYTEGERWGFRVAIGAAIQNHLMPPPKYVWMHSDARLSSDEIEFVKAWALSKHKISPNTVESAA